MFSDKAELTPPNKLFPELFETEEIKEVKINNDMELYKAKMDDFAFRHNQRLKRKEE